MGLLSKHDEAKLDRQPQAAPEGAPPPYEAGTATREAAPAPGPVPMQQQQQPGPGAVSRQFPPTFNIYSNGAFKRSYTLGMHQNQPLYHVSIHSGWSGKPDVVLHNGSDESTPPLASVTLGRWSGGMEVDLPPAQPGGSTAESVAASGWWSRAHIFSIEVPGPKGFYREDFEWKRSRGNEVSQLGAWSGWKLTRLNGGEIVATCANATMSMSKFFQFQFLGSAANGVLGERFAVMSVITALGLFEQAKRSRNGAAAGASGAAAC